MTEEERIKKIDEEIDELVKSADEGLNSWDDVPPVCEDEEYKRY